MGGTGFFLLGISAGFSGFFQHKPQRWIARFLAILHVTQKKTRSDFPHFVVYRFHPSCQRPLNSSVIENQAVSAIKARWANGHARSYGSAYRQPIDHDPAVNDESFSNPPHAQNGAFPRVASAAWCWKYLAAPVARWKRIHGGCLTEQLFQLRTIIRN